MNRDAIFFKSILYSRLYSMFVFHIIICLSYILYIYILYNLDYMYYVLYYISYYVILYHVIVFYFCIYVPYCTISCDIT